MGAYLSKPVTEKVSSDESNDKLKFGASSMQGWRVYQEDAHNAELDLGGHAFFAVYDGHGGHEVATYTAAEFPSFLQKNESFCKGDFEQSLTDSFLEFDGTLIEPKINVMLREIAGRKDQEDSDYAGDEIDHLCREAAMPLEEVMAKYSSDSPQQSPNSKNKSAECEDMASTSGASSSCKRRLKTLHKDSCIDEEDMEEEMEEEMEQSTKEENKKIETEENIKKTEINNQDENIKPEKDVKTDEQKIDVIEKKTDCNGASDKCVNGSLEDIKINGEISDEGGGGDVEKGTETSSSQKENEENGPSPSIKGKGAKEGGHKGKAVAKSFGVSVGSARRAMMNPIFRQLRLASLQRSATLVTHDDDDDEDDDEDEEEEEKCSGEEDSSSQDEEEEEEEDFY